MRKKGSDIIKKALPKELEGLVDSNCYICYWIMTLTFCSQSCIGAKILRRPLSYLASVFSGNTSWANMKQPEYSVSSPLGAETQKLSFLISRVISFLSTPGSSNSIFKPPFWSSCETQVQGVSLKYGDWTLKIQGEGMENLCYENT